MEYLFVIGLFIASNLISFALGYRQASYVSERYYRNMEKTLRESNDLVGSILLDD